MLKLEAKYLLLTPTKYFKLTSKIQERVLLYLKMYLKMLNFIVNCYLFQDL